MQSERGALQKLARLHSQRDEDAEDALSDAAVQFLRFYDGPPGTRALNWMKLVTKRCAWQIKRRAQARESTVTIEVTDAPVIDHKRLIIAVDERSGPEERTLRFEEVSEVKNLLATLKPDERTALLLLGLGYSYKEIGQMQGWTMTKVTRCVKEGRAAFRKMSGRGANS
jgi:RNA polymerase sigma factor (sigma-70 family)